MSRPKRYEDLTPAPLDTPLIVRHYSFHAG